jgi:hypothetical protein
LLLDVAQTAQEQLEVVEDALRGEANAGKAIRSPQLAERLNLRKAA